MAEWSIATVLKTVDCQRSGGSNPSLSAHKNSPLVGAFLLIINRLFIQESLKNRPVWVYLVAAV